MLHAKDLINGQEQHEKFYSSVRRSYWIQYDYRHTDGELFSCVARTLEICIQKRNQWINRKLMA
jgi:hypothetical protein